MVEYLMADPLLYPLLNATAMRILMRIDRAVILEDIKAMQPLYDYEAPKKATNLSINSDLLKRSRALSINLSATLEQALKDKLAQTEAQKWIVENKNAIKTYNDFVDKHGCFSDEFREF